MASLKRTALAAITCISGPPCVPGKTAELSFFSISALSRARIRPPRGPRSVLCVVVVTTSAIGTGIRIDAGGDQPGDMGHVDHQIGADLVGNVAEALPVDDLASRRKSRRRSSSAGAPRPARRPPRNRSRRCRRPGRTARRCTACRKNSRLAPWVRWPPCVEAHAEHGVAGLHSARYTAALAWEPECGCTLA